VFLRTFPIAPQFLVPYCLAKAEMPCSYILCERGRGGRSKEAYMLGSAPCSKNTGDGPIKWFFLKKKKKHGCASLFNRSMNK
jgi:hypothetical protein